MNLSVTKMVICLAVSKYVLEMSKVAVEKGMKTACFWCGPLPLITVHEMQDIQVNESLNLCCLSLPMVLQYKTAE